MIDSIQVKIPTNQIISSSIFGDKQAKATDNNVRVIKMFPKHMRAYRKMGIYKPTIHIELRGGQKYVCIQCSLPKLLYGTSLFEVTEADFDLATERLAEECRELGVSLNKEQIANGRIHRIDYTKIIILPKSFTNAKDFIEKLSTSGFRSRTDLTHRDVHLGKGGYWIKFYSRASSLTIYDKIAELENQGFTKQESLLKNKLGKHVLKFEVSLQKVRKLQSVLSKFSDVKKDRYSLRDAFSKDIAQKVLQDYLNTSFNEEVDFLCMCLKEKELINHVRNLYGYSQKSYIYYILKEIEERGAQTVYYDIKKIHNYQRLRRVKHDLKKLKDELATKAKSRILPVSFLAKKLNEFTLYKPSS